MDEDKGNGEQVVNKTNETVADRVGVYVVVLAVLVAAPDLALAQDIHSRVTTCA